MDDSPEIDPEDGVPDWVVMQGLMAEADFIVNHYRQHLNSRQGAATPPPPSDADRIRAILNSL